MRTLSIIVPTYKRPASLARLLASIARYTPPNTETVVVVQDGSEAPAWTRAIHTEPCYPARARRLGASIALGELLLFLDDDHELLPAFAAHWHALSAAALQPALVSFPVRQNNHPHPRIVAMSGGMLIPRDVYWQVGGHGEDYLDDVELCLRCRWAGITIYRYHTPVTVHHYGERGGLRERSEVNPKRTAHVRLSRLDERYPDKLVKEPRSWWGFKEVRRGR